MPINSIATHKQDLNRLIQLSARQVDTYVLFHGILTTDTLDAAAECIACLMIDYCCASQSLKESWQAKRDGGMYVNASDAKQLDGFLGPIFGTKSKPVPQDHTQGAVAEFLWYILFDQQDDIAKERVLLDGPDFRPTSPGGDGLGVYKEGEDAYFFKLWEIKKHTAADSPKNKVSKAAKQLDDRAISYLSQYATVLSRRERDNNLAKFYAELPRYWIDRLPEAGIGISVSSDKDFPANSFRSITDKFNWIADSSRQTGVSIYIEHFAELVMKVQQKVLEGME